MFHGPWVQGINFNCNIFQYDGSSVDMIQCMDLLGKIEQDIALRKLQACLAAVSIHDTYTCIFFGWYFKWLSYIAGCTESIVFPAISWKSTTFGSYENFYIPLTYVIKYIEINEVRSIYYSCFLVTIGLLFVNSFGFTLGTIKLNFVYSFLTAYL